MATQKSHVRDIAATYYQTANGGANGLVGPVVPVGKRMHVVYAKIAHTSTTPCVLSMFRDGAGMSVPLDVNYIPGSGTNGVGGDFRDLGEASIDFHESIESPIYILEAGQQIGFDSQPAVTVYVTITAYIEP